MKRLAGFYARPVFCQVYEKKKKLIILYEDLLCILPKKLFLNHPFYETYTTHFAAVFSSYIFWA